VTFFNPGTSEFSTSTYSLAIDLHDRVSLEWSGKAKAANFDVTGRPASGR
jgi:hypothetical protein